MLHTLRYKFLSEIVFCSPSCNAPTSLAMHYKQSKPFKTWASYGDADLEHYVIAHIKDHHSISTKVDFFQVPWDIIRTMVVLYRSPFVLLHYPSSYPLVPSFHTLDLLEVCTHLPFLAGFYIWNLSDDCTFIVLDLGLFGAYVNAVK